MSFDCGIAKRTGYFENWRPPPGTTVGLRSRFGQSGFGSVRSGLGRIALRSLCCHAFNV